jgi:hypothetical protein
MGLRLAGLLYAPNVRADIQVDSRDLHVYRTTGIITGNDIISR